jgi:hypothetical protein
MKKLSTAVKATKPAAVEVRPAAVAVPPAKVAPKKAAVKAAPKKPQVLGDAMKKLASIPAPESRTQRRADAKSAPEGVPVPEAKYIPVKKTSTASLAGSLSAISQARHILYSSRSFGEALDELGRLEADARGQLKAAIDEELKKSRIKSDGYNIGTESKPDGVHIVLTKPVTQ